MENASSSSTRSISPVDSISSMEASECNSVENMDSNATAKLNVEEERRYRRLQHLLEKSSIYSKFLLQRMQNQIEHEKEERKKVGRRRKTAVSTEQQPTNPDKKEFGLRAKRKASGDVSPKSSAPRPKRKKQATQESYKMQDYISNEGQLIKKSTENHNSNENMDPCEEEKTRMFEGVEVSSRQPRLFTGGIMRDYQLDGMEWLKVLWENGVNGILGDEMGLGKTIQCIALVALLMGNGVKGPFLVVGPLSTLNNWESEFKRFAPTVPTVLYHGSMDERELLRRKHLTSLSRKKALEERSGPVVITNFETCMADVKYLYHQNWKYIILDEGHRIKNMNCKLVKDLKKFNAENRLLLTGTPLQNNLSELWSLLNFLLPDVFDDLECFEEYFDFTSVGDQTGNEKILAQEREQNVLSTLHQILTPFLLRRLKSDVELQVPPKKEVLVYAPLSPVQLKLYKALLENAFTAPPKEEEVTSLAGQGRGKRKCTKRAEMAIKIHQNEGLVQKLLLGDVQYDDLVPTEVVKQKARSSVFNLKLASMMMMFRKCVNHPYLIEFPLTEKGELRVDEDLIRGAGKMLLLDRMLPSLLQLGHKVLVFSQMTMMLDIIEDYLEIRSYRYSRLDGTMSLAIRQQEMKKFNEDPDCGIFLVSTRAGGLGINLTAADTVIIYDSDWNPQADLQAQDRCHRIGQTKPVMVYRLVTANTIDQKIVETAAGKRKLEKMVIHKGLFKGHNQKAELLTLDSLRELLESMDHDKVFESAGSEGVISDEMLKRLLDRSMCTDQTENEPMDEETASFSVLQTTT